MQARAEEPDGAVEVVLDEPMLQDLFEDGHHESQAWHIQGSQQTAQTTNEPENDDEREAGCRGRQHDSEDLGPMGLDAAHEKEAQVTDPYDAAGGDEAAEEDNEDNYMNSAWADNRAMKAQMHGTSNIKFR